MVIGKVRGRICWGLLVLLLAAGSLHDTPAASAEPPNPALAKETDALLLEVAKQSRKVRQIVDGITANETRLKQTNAALPQALREYETLKAVAEKFDLEWRKNYAKSCGQEFRDEEKYSYWLKKCRAQLARETENEKKLTVKGQSYNELLDEQRLLAKGQSDLKNRLKPEKAALDVLLLKLVANPLLARCGRCLENIKSTLEVAECYLACWLSPG